MLKLENFVKINIMGYNLLVSGKFMLTTTGSAYIIQSQLTKATQEHDFRFARSATFSDLVKPVEYTMNFYHKLICESSGYSLHEVFFSPPRFSSLPPACGT